MSYFNSDQQDHMKHLASLPRDKKCKCGWNGIDDCYNPTCIDVTRELNRLKRVARENKGS